MKILAISCSPRKGKNTDILLREALKGAEKEGAQVDFFSVIGKEMKACDGCWTCVKTGRCHIEDDMQDLYQKMKDSSGILIGTPVYFFGMASQAKILIDRTCALQPFGEPLSNKIGGIVVVAGSTGTIDVIKDFHMFFGLHRMILANWVAVYSPVNEKEKGMKAAFDLGMEVVQIARRNIQYTSTFTPNHFAYGTHTH
jgi:multimeric flavodoxin WrbA